MLPRSVASLHKLKQPKQQQQQAIDAKVSGTCLKPPRRAEKELVPDARSPGLKTDWF